MLSKTFVQDGHAEQQHQRIRLHVASLEPPSKTGLVLEEKRLETSSKERVKSRSEHTTLSEIGIVLEEERLEPSSEESVKSSFESTALEPPSKLVLLLLLTLTGKLTSVTVPRK
jgi:hypothetical protein